jgi:CMP/dCMP kinase
MVASAHERARRRFLDNQERGIDGGTIEELQRAIELRDQKDSTRAVSPLTQAVDAHLLDTTHLTIDQVVDQIATLIEKTQQQKQ